MRTVLDRVGVQRCTDAEGAPASEVATQCWLVTLPTSDWRGAGPHGRPRRQGGPPTDLAPTLAWCVARKACALGRELIASPTSDWRGAGPHGRPGR